MLELWQTKKIYEQTDIVKLALNEKNSFKPSELCEKYYIFRLKKRERCCFIIIYLLFQTLIS